MKNKIKVLLGVILSVILSCTLLIACNDDKGDNDDVEIKPAKTEEVDSYEDLLAVSSYVGKTYSNYTIKLTADIDLTGKEWKPIGSTLDKAFMGVFDGNGHTIKGLTITGWSDNGAPLYIAKKIIGWLSDGTPVYESSEIINVTKGETVSEGKTEAKEIVREGDNADPNYVKLSDGDGYFEKSVSYGSVGLFGYTSGATIKNLTVSGADISFYAPDDSVYAGIVSGYDVSSEFNNVNVIDGKIAVSTLFTESYTYADYYGTPNMPIRKNTSNQYVGGIVGYAKSNSVKENNALNVKNTVFNNVVSNEFIFDNTNYSAYYSGQLVIVGQEKDAKLVVDENKQRGYIVTNVQRDIDDNLIPNDWDYPARLYSGGIAGYIDGGKLNTVKTSGYNKANAMGDGINPIEGTTLVMGQSAYVGGISGCIYNSLVDTANAENIYAIAINKKGQGLFKTKGTIAGAFGIVSNTKITNGNVNAFSAEIGGRDIESACVGGYAGYAYDATEISGVSVNNMYAYSTYTNSVGNSDSDNELGSILAGAVGVMRDASVENATVETVKFKIAGGKKADYVFTRGIVSQIYGESTFKNSTAKDVKIYDKDTIFADSYEDVTPVLYKNNYVNEDGFTSARLYYMVDNKHSGVYVTVLGQAVPYDESENSLIKETIYTKVDLSSKYTEGVTIETGKYYYYDSENDRYNFIIEDTDDELKKFKSSTVYAVKTEVYRVEFKEANKNQTLKVNTYYEYTKSTGEYKLTSDANAKTDKTYYINLSSATISGYYLNVTVYSESGNKIIVDDKNASDEDDDVLAVATYKMNKETFDNAVKTQILGNKEYVLAEAESYLNVYFENGTGFKADMNGFVIKYHDSSVANRDFSKYSLITGRPIVESISYN